MRWVVSTYPLRGGDAAYNNTLCAGNELLSTRLDNVTFRDIVELGARTRRIRPDKY
ncbi:MAG: hypothetical protein MAG451_02809 [Anaerolineales bacterium]|nr:hypothetical protein [Anaerolineales bacterium]